MSQVIWKLKTKLILIQFTSSQLPLTSSCISNGMIIASTHHKKSLTSMLSLIIRGQIKFGFQTFTFPMQLKRKFSVCSAQLFTFQFQKIISWCKPFEWMSNSNAKWIYQIILKMSNGVLLTLHRWRGQIKVSHCSGHISPRQWLMTILNLELEALRWVIAIRQIIWEHIHVWKPQLSWSVEFHITSSRFIHQHF